VAGWTLVGANDFDGNGVPDLVYQNTSTGIPSMANTPDAHLFCCKSGSITGEAESMALNGIRPDPIG